MYGGEGCQGKQKVVCYPARGGRASGRLEISTTAGSWPADPLPAHPPPKKNDTDESSTLLSFCAEIQ
jgi:hypothetical protein